MFACRVLLLAACAALAATAPAHAAFPTAVNDQITDSVTQTNVQVLGEAPAMAMGSLYATIGNSVAMAAANAVYAQQQDNVTYQAATTDAVQSLEGLDTTGCGVHLTAALLAACAMSG